MTHPAPETLRDFVLGELAEDDERVVREHLAAGCDACQAAIHEEAALDHAMWEVRQAADREGAGPTVDDVAPVTPLRRAPRRALRWAAGGGIAVAASAVLAISVVAVRDDASPVAQAPSALAPGATTVPGAGPPPATPAAAATEAKEEAKEEAEEEAKKEAKEKTKAAATATKSPPARPSKTSTRSKTAVPKKPAGATATTKAEPPPPAARRARKRDCDPILDLDCADAKANGRAGSKRTLSPTDVLSVVRKNLGDVDECGREHDVTGTVRMEWRILKNGRTSSVRVLTERYQDTPVGKCLQQAIKKWRFPASTGKPPPPVKFPFKLKGR